MIIKTSFLVAIGLILSIVSILISTFYIDTLIEESSDYLQQKEQNEKLIALTWQNIEALERKKEWVIALILKADEENEAWLNTSVINNLGGLIEADDLALNEQSEKEWQQRFDSAQGDLRNRIDDLYLENIKLTEMQNAQDKKSAFARNIALFLQVLGLSLVLARDLTYDRNK